MEYHLNFKYNSVFFVESLDDPKSTKSLFQDIVQRRCEANGFFASYTSVKNKNDFVNVIASIKNLTRNSLYPILHIAAHGDESGIKLVDDFISWEEFEPVISGLNIKTRNHLILIMALCKGAFATTLFNINQERAPYYFMIGPSRNILEKTLDGLLHYFYDEMLQSLDLKKALRTMELYHGERIPFFIYSCVQLLQDLFEDHRGDLRKGKLRHELIKLYEETRGIRPAHDFKSKVQYPEELEPFFNEIMNEFKKKYFMIDLFPENEERFSAVIY